MEASKSTAYRPPTPTVRALDDRLVIERLEVDDERSAQLVRERIEAGQSAEQTVRDAIEIGARVLEREGVGAEVDYVKAEFGKHAGELAERLVKSIESGNELLAEEIAKSFGADRQGTVQQQIKEMLDRTAEAQRESLARQFSASDGSNPLFDFKESVVRALKESDARQQKESGEAREAGSRQLTREVVELKERDQADRRVAEAEEAGTRKGLDFEDRVDEAITADRFSAGDSASHTGGELADGGGKKGDTVVELGAAEGPSVRADRVRGEGQDASPATPPGRSSTRGWRREPRHSGSSSSLAMTGFRRSASSSPSITATS